MKKKSNKYKYLAALALLALGINHMRAPSDEYLRSRTVKLVSSRGSCSGEQVRAPSGTDYILTAGHCKVLEENGAIGVETEDGKKLPVLVIAEDPESDMLLLQGLPGVRGLDVAASTDRLEHVKTWTHGAGLKSYRSEGEIIERQHVDVPVSEITGPADEAACTKMPKNRIVSFDTFFGPMRLCAISFDAVLSTAFVVPGSSGGPVFNDSGELVGVVSFSDQERFSGFVPADSINKFLANF